MKIGAKRFLSLMLCCIMVLGLFSVTAFAATAGETVTITKEWDDKGFNFDHSNDNVTINVFKDGGNVADQTVVLNSTNEWKGSFQAEAGHNYTIEEESVSNYDVEYTEPGEGYISVSNWGKKITPASEATYTLTKDMVVAKKGNGFDIWTSEPVPVDQRQNVIDAINAAKLNGLKPKLTIENTMFADVLPATFRDDKNNTVTIDRDGNDVKISFGKTSAWSLFYEGTLTIKKATGWIVKNTYNPKINIDVTKVWEHKENKETPTSVQVQLYADGEILGDPVTLQSNIDESKNWKVTFKDLPKYYYDGTKIIYSVQEIKVPGYDSSVEGSVENGFIITNTYNAQQPEKLSFSFLISKIVEQSGNVAPGKQTFTFELVDDKGRTPAAYGIDIDAITVSTDGAGRFSTTVNGTVDFDEVIAVSTDGLRKWYAGANSSSDAYYYCTFTLKENNGGAPGWTYSDRQYHVTICYYPATGNTNASAIAFVEDLIDENNPSFTNTYTATSAPESKPESKPIRDTVTIEIGNNGKPEEANPDTGAPLMFVPVMAAALAAAVVVKRKK